MNTIAEISHGASMVSGTIISSLGSFFEKVLVRERPWPKNDNRSPSSAVPYQPRYPQMEEAFSQLISRLTKESTQARVLLPVKSSYCEDDGWHLFGDFDPEQLSSILDLSRMPDGSLCRDLLGESLIATELISDEDYEVVDCLEQGVVSTEKLVQPAQVESIPRHYVPIRQPNVLIPIEQLIQPAPVKCIPQPPVDPIERPEEILVKFSDRSNCQGSFRPTFVPGALSRPKPRTCRRDPLVVKGATILHPGKSKMMVVHGIPKGWKVRVFLELDQINDKTDDEIGTQFFLGTRPIPKKGDEHSWITIDCDNNTLYLVARSKRVSRIMHHLRFTVQDETAKVIRDTTLYIESQNHKHESSSRYQRISQMIGYTTLDILSGKIISE